jgi:methanogenic corrinoid protein MtbC1
MSAVMNTVGNLYNTGEYFAGELLNNAISVQKSILKSKVQQKQGRSY